MNIIYNPIVLGASAGLGTYFFLDFQNKEKNKEINKKNKKRKIKNKPLEKLGTVNLVIPLVVMIIIWFLIYAYFNFNATTQNSKIINDLKIKNPIPLAPDKNYRFIKDIISSSSDSSNQHSFSMLGNGVTIPNNLPDVLLEIY
jgi:quinol-cytochrome oxidoreductase complex cytochrome b subunit